MASELADKKVAELISEFISAELKAHGETKPGAIGPLIRAKYPEAAATYAAELFDGTVSRKAAAQLKSWFTVSLAGETQLFLPGIPVDVLAEIPPTITVPDGKNEPRHVLLSRVTVGEFRAWEQMLFKQIEDDKRKHKAARYIVAKISGLPDDAYLREAFGVLEAAE
ncbi:hypothetical protein [Pseudaminobacter soli (ex Li et al. 2025)]|uniref:Uncharacterized protein n=1 Tax=Pseudaminobacter soli (ex Li et al. 2025) TaxID=1295366 RepID=A0A2P7SE45_9HYPH|nr:hypothetical protein [Mesorhizobium soli]PSJ60782.1 hypothetical protein C7I85_12125 [Mesorhizobium soli]